MSIYKKSSSVPVWGIFFFKDLRPSPCVAPVAIEALAPEEHSFSVPKGFSMASREFHGFSKVFPKYIQIPYPPETTSGANKTFKKKTYTRFTPATSINQQPKPTKTKQKTKEDFNKNLNKNQRTNQKPTKTPCHFSSFLLFPHFSFSISQNRPLHHSRSPWPSLPCYHGWSAPAAPLPENGPRRREPGWVLFARCLEKETLGFLCFGRFGRSLPVSFWGKNRE